MASRLIAVVAIFAIISAVFYVTFIFFSQGEVASSSEGNIDIDTQLLYIKLGALAVFLMVAIGGIYISFRILAAPDPNDKRRRKKERYMSWKVDFKAIQFPSFRSEEEDEKEKEKEDQKPYKRAGEEQSK